MVPRRNWKKGPSTAKLQNLSEISWFACVLLLVLVGGFVLCCLMASHHWKMPQHKKQPGTTTPWIVSRLVTHMNHLPMKGYFIAFTYLLFGQNFVFGNFPITGCYASTLTLNSERVFCDQFVMEEWQTIRRLLGGKMVNFELKFGQ